jgi:N-acetylglucosaminyldiphosphoundecaprenol N-acetyl-beta-D-mannosaminyltransferase
MTGTDHVTGAGQVGVPRRCEFLGIGVDTLTVSGLFDACAAAIAGNRHLVIANHNLHSLYLHRRSPAMRRFFAEADYAHADGMWIIYLARLFGQPLRRDNRIAGLDWLGPLLQRAELAGWRVFFLGGTPSVAERFGPYLREHYASLSFGHHHGYFDAAPSSAENQQVLAAIQALSPHLLFVCMGMPRQEEWILANRGQLTANAVFPQGGLMDYLVEETARPPRWTGPLGVEWAYRLLHDPGRLAGRYLLEPARLAPWIATEAWRSATARWRQRTAAAHGRSRPL